MVLCIALCFASFGWKSIEQLHFESHWNARTEEETNSPSAERSMVTGGDVGIVAEDKRGFTAFWGKIQCCLIRGFDLFYERKRLFEAGVRLIQYDVSIHSAQLLKYSTENWWIIVRRYKNSTGTTCASKCATWKSNTIRRESFAANPFGIWMRNGYEVCVHLKLESNYSESAIFHLNTILSSHFRRHIAALPALELPA